MFDNVIIAVEARKGVPFDWVLRDAMQIRLLLEKDIELLFNDVRLIVGEKDTQETLWKRYQDHLEGIPNV